VPGVVLRTVSESEDDAEVHVGLAMGEPDAERGRASDSGSRESAEECVDLTVGRHGAERGATAARVPLAYVDFAHGPAEGPVAFVDLALSDVEERLEVALAERVRGRAEDGDSW
jgi:hypothetical protein